MSTPTSSAPDALRLARDLVTPALRVAVERLCPDMAQVASYHHGWTDKSGRPTPKGGGKALRPALALLSTQAAGAPPEQGVPAAVAVELVHSFSLLHDDIMDGDTERRHRPTAWRVFGTSPAILAGDSLLTEAAAVLLEQPVTGAAAARRLMTDTQRLITGQTADLDFEHRDDVTLDECVRMVGNKTGALLASSCALGAILVGARADLVDGLAEFGEHLGVAFQLVDDLLGIWGAPERTGKPVLSDLRSRKKSLPVVAALNADHGAAKFLAGLYLGDVPLEESSLPLIAELIEKAGGRAWAEQEAGRRLTAAFDCLVDLSLPDQVIHDLEQIAHFVTERSY